MRLFVKLFHEIFKLKEITFYNVWSLETNAGHITFSQRQSKVARIGNTLPHQNQRNSVQLCELEKWCSCSSGTVNVQCWKFTCPEKPLSTVKHTVICLKPSVMICSVLALLVHDNMESHMACATAQQITTLHLECLPHLLYSPDLAPCDYRVFGKTLDGKIEEAVHSWP